MATRAEALEAARFLIDYLEDEPITALPPVSDKRNEAIAYGVEIIDAKKVPCWRVRNVRHLPGKENQGKHNIYVYAFDQHGNRASKELFLIGWSWEGQRPNEASPPKLLDKPDHEPHGNIDIYWGQKVNVWIQGQNIDSDKVMGMHTNHPDENMYNTPGHHSFEIVFQLFVPPGTEV